MMTPEQLGGEVPGKPDITDEDEVEASRAPLLDHLNELRGRLIKVLIGMAITFGIGVYFSAEIFQILARPYMEAQAGNENARMIFTGLMEGFAVNLKVALYGAFIVTFPLLALQLWKFVAPGLYRDEKKSIPAVSCGNAHSFRHGRFTCLFPCYPMGLAVSAEL